MKQIEKWNQNVDAEILSVRERLLPVIRERSYRENHTEPFTLASGKKSPYYFDLKQTLMEPEALWIAARGLYCLMLKHLDRTPSSIGGLTMGADPLVYSVCLLAADSGETIYPLIVRKQTKDHGSKKRVEGCLDKVLNAPIALIDDVITTGGSTLQAYEALKEAGLEARAAFCILDRKEGGAENLASHGVTLYPLFKLEDFAGK